MGIGDPRSGGNFTQPWPVVPADLGPRRFLVYLGWDEIGSYETHAEAERELRRAFVDYAMTRGTVLPLFEVSEAA